MPPLHLLVIWNYALLVLPPRLAPLCGPETNRHQNNALDNAHNQTIKLYLHTTSFSHTN